MRKLLKIVFLLVVVTLMRTEVVCQTTNRTEPPKISFVKNIGTSDTIIDVYFDRPVFSNKEATDTLTIDDFDIRIIGGKKLKFDSINLWRPKDLTNTKFRVYLELNRSTSGWEQFFISAKENEVFDEAGEAVLPNVQQPSRIPGEVAYQAYLKFPTSCIYKTIEVNSNNQFKSSLPFAEPFQIYVSGDETQHIVKAFLYYEVGSELVRKRELNFDDNSIAKVGDKTYALRIPPLLSRQRIYLGVIYKMSDKLLEEFMKVNDLLLQNEEAEAEKQFQKHRKTFTNDIQTFTFGHWGDYKQMYEDEIESLYQNLTISFNAGLLVKNEIDTVEKLLKKHSIGLSELPQLRLIVQSGTVDDLVNGTINLQNIHNESRPGQLAERLMNLNSTKDTLLKLQNLLSLLKSRIGNPPCAELARLETGIEELRTTLDEAITNHKQAKSSILEAIRNNPKFHYGSFIFGSSNFASMQTEAGHFIIPELGFAYVPAFSQNGGIEYLGLTYAGVSIYLKPVNKELRKDCLDWSFQRRFSINLGATLSSINSDEFSNYSGAAFLIGGNYKITRILAVSAGGIIMKQVDINPIIDDRQTVVRPYVGVSLDVDVASAAKSFTNFLK